jgi:hypothetical protein
MKTKQYQCEGSLCHPMVVVSKADLEAYGHINTCIAKSVDDGKWKVPDGWAVIKNKVYCPRCYDQYLKDKITQVSTASAGVGKVNPSLAGKRCTCQFDGKYCESKSFDGCGNFDLPLTP